MSQWTVATLIIWFSAIVGTLVMRKVSPESYKVYAVYVLVICIAFTALAGSHGF